MTGFRARGAALLATLTLTIAGCVAAEVSPAPSPPVEATLPATPSPSPTPSGPGIHWIAGQVPDVGLETALLGWKGGFLYGGLEWPDGWEKPAIIHVWASADGLTWHEAASIRTLGEVDGPLSLVEGPNGLILGGWQGGCNTITGLGEMWLSSDGETWKELPLPFGKTSLVSMAGGPAGYIATGRDSSVPVVWTSRDGRHWARAALGGTGFAGSTVQSAAVFAPGFVIVGAVVTTGSTCPGLMQVGTAWFSADGVHWKKAVVPGALVGFQVTSDLFRIDDRTLLLRQSEGDKEAWWISRDGMSWEKADLPERCSFVIGGMDYGYCYDTRRDSSRLWRLDARGVTELWQTGSPAPNGYFALAPAGLLVLGNRGTSWLGVPAGS